MRECCVVRYIEEFVPVCQCCTAKVIRATAQGVDIKASQASHLI